MKLKYKFITNEVADKFVAVAVGDDMDEFKGFVKMNDVGAEIFALLENEISENDLVASMCEKHPDTAEAEVREAVTEFVSGLDKENLIIY